MPSWSMLACVLARCVSSVAVVRGVIVGGVALSLAVLGAIDNGIAIALGSVVWVGGHGVFGGGGGTTSGVLDS
eukprot:3216679-Alexandrium_andersonii.AAC.1